MKPNETDHPSQDDGTCAVHLHRRRARLRVVVAHRSPLVAAGIASTLRRLPSCVVKVREPRDAAGAALAGGSADLVFGDETTASAVCGRAAGQAKAADEASPKVIVVTTGDATRAPLRELAQQPDACISVDCGERELLDTVERLVELRVTAPRGGLAPGALRRVREHVDARLAQRIEIDDMAAIAGLSPCHFGRAFKQSLGVPPHRYVMQRRIETATRLIRDTGRKLAEIALDVGFCDQSHFTRLFASYHGVTPLEFRRLNR